LRGFLNPNQRLTLGDQCLKARPFVFSSTPDLK
jgi:hypothetical protein